MQIEILRACPPCGSPIFVHKIISAALSACPIDPGSASGERESSASGEDFSGAFWPAFRDLVAKFLIEAPGTVTVTITPEGAKALAEAREDKSP